MDESFTATAHFYGGVVTHLKYLEHLLVSGQGQEKLCVHEHKLKKKSFEAHLICHHLFEAFLAFTELILFSYEVL